MDLEVKTLPERRLAAVRHTGPYHLIGAAFETLGRIAGPAGLFASPDAAMIGVYLDEPETSAPEKLRSLAAMAVGEDAVLPAGLVEARMPAGRFLCLTHIGAYAQLPDRWKELKAELAPTGGYRRRLGASYEIYVNNPMQVPEAELRTDICIPIE